jgi:Peptidase A4 family
MAQVPSASSREALQRVLPWQLLETSLPGVYWTPAPPDDLDLNAADKTTLLRHGLLSRRPGPGDHPKVQAAWNRAFTGNRLAIKRIKPEFGIQSGKTHQVWTDNAWAGGVVEGGQDSYTAANGFWTVPTVSEPKEPPGTDGGWSSSSWIGIDGMAPDTDVLQAGIQQDVDKYGNASYTAFYEWFVPNATPAELAQYPYIAPVPITNAQVVPGQTIWCSVQYVNNIAGVVYLANESTGVGFLSRSRRRLVRRLQVAPLSGSWRRPAAASRHRRFRHLLR